jgi:hypothetical protein
VPVGLASGMAAALHALDQDPGEIARMLDILADTEEAFAREEEQS